MGRGGMKKLHKSEGRVSRRGVIFGLMFTVAFGVSCFSGAENNATTSASSTTASTTLGGPGPFVIDGVSGEVFEGLSLSNPSGACVEITNSSDVTFRNSRIGPCAGPAIEVEQSEGVFLESLEISDTETGIYVLDSRSISVSGNTFRDAGRNFVQFDKVTGPDNKIVGNAGMNTLGGSNAEDLISVYKSSGTAESPIEVLGNHLSDGGPSRSGSGIMVGDAGGSHIVVQDNVLMNPGQVGIGVAGGSNIRVLDNTVFSTSHPWSNVGIYVWNQSSGSCAGIEVRGNQVDWTNAVGKSNSKWDGKNCGVITGWGDNG